MKTRTDRVLDWRELSLTAAAALVLSLLWYTPLILPLRFFSVLVHECSHAIAGILTGGSVERITLQMNEGGVTYIQGGIPAIYGSAGYLGSVLFGSLFLYLCRFERSAGRLCMGVGLLLMSMTLAFVSPLYDLFGFLYGSCAGLLIGLVGWKWDRFAPYFMRFLGVAVSLFAFMDIQLTLFHGAAALQHSDAGILERATGIPSILWAGSWLIFAAVMFITFAYLSATRQAGRTRAIASSAKTLVARASAGAARR